MSVVRSQGSEWWVIVLACCDETKFGPNLISLSPHVSHFIRSINTLSGFNETPAVNYWLDSLRPYAPLEPGRHRLELNWVSAWWPWWGRQAGTTATTSPLPSLSCCSPLTRVTHRHEDLRQHCTLETGDWRYQYQHHDVLDLYSTACL